MNIKDQGLILSVRKYSENSLIIKILSENHGLYSGFIKGALSSKKPNIIYQIGNLVEFHWQAKSEENLGFFKIELLKSFLGDILSDPIRLNSIITAVNLIAQNMPERQENSEIFFKLLDLLKNLNHADLTGFLIDYINLEIDLLRNLGYGIELDKCAVTGLNENLYFVSPKSGRAVSKDAGEKYADKLLKLPQFLIKNDSQITKNDLLKGLELGGFFIDKYLYKPANLSLPDSRNRLINFIKNSNFIPNSSSTVIPTKAGIQELPSDGFPSSRE